MGPRLLARPLRRLGVGTIWLGWGGYGWGWGWGGFGAGMAAWGLGSALYSGWGYMPYVNPYYAYRLPTTVVVASR